jgi:hypothetical protein
MKECDVRRQAFAMPLTNPAYPRGPYRFCKREYLIIAYRTDERRLREIVPEPLRVEEPVVKYEFIRMPDSTGFGDYTESGQVIPVSFEGRHGNYSHCMFLNGDPAIAGGRELWGFPKKLASPSLRPEIDTLVGTLDHGPVRVATGTMGYKHSAPTSPRSRMRSPPRISCSRSSPMSTARRASASSSSTASRTSSSRAHGPGRAPSTFTLTRSRRWPSCRCLRCCPPHTSSPTSPWASAK